MLVLEDKVKNNRAAFIAKVVEVAANLKTNPNYLMGVMYSESGLNPVATNAVSGAVGLLQFMPKTLSAMGLTTSYVLSLSNVQQLDIVEKYLMPYRGKLNSYSDVYFSVFFPIAVNKPDSWVFQTDKLSAALIAKQNAAIDLNKDGKITVAEFKKYILNILPASVRKIISSMGGATFLIVLLAAYLILK